MKDPRRNNRRRRPKDRELEDRELEDALETSMPSYTPEHRRAVLKGLRILARVAIRFYMEEQAARSRDQDGGGRKNSKRPSNAAQRRRITVLWPGAVYFTERYLVMETGVRRFHR